MKTIGSYRPAIWCALVAALGAALLPVVGAEPPMVVELPTGFLPADWVASAMKKTLSAQGRYILLPTGAVRISDEQTRIDAARQTLAEWQRAPATASIELLFKTVVPRTVQARPAEPAALDREIPFPHQFDPPKVVMRSGGGFTVVPSQPRDFRTRSVGSGAVVNPSGTGFTTLSPEVRTTESTSTVTTTPRRFALSLVPGKAGTLPVLAQVQDVAGLRRLAQQLGAVAASEAEWSSAATELAVTPEISGGALAITLVPHLAVVPRGPTPSARRIPLKACAATILAVRQARTNTGLLPHTDAEFYRLFLGNTPAGEGSYTSVTVTADVRYIGSPPN